MTTTPPPRPTPTHTTALDYRQRIARVLRHLQDVVATHDAGAAADLSPPTLAALAHLSPAHFSRIFTAMTGETLTAHTRRLRLEKAAGLLARTDDQVVRIALACGYTAHEPFTRAFTAHFGQSPRDYRAAATEPLAIPPALNGVHFGIDDAVSRFVPTIMKENPMLDVKIKPVPARRLAALHHTGDYHAIGQTFGKLAGMAGPLGLFGPHTQMVGVYHDDPKETPKGELRSDAGITITEDASLEGSPLTELRIPASTCAVGVFKGPYARLDEAYSWLYGTWLAQSGYEPTGHPPFEVYLNNPQDTAPEDLLTEICIPLKA